MKNILNNLRLYAVTDRQWAKAVTLEQQIEEAIRGGVTMVQLREKDMKYEEFLEEAKRVKIITSKYGIPLIINDNVDIAIESDADGVHVGQSDTDAANARKRLGNEKIVGVTVRNAEQAIRAEKNGADYLGAGAVFGSTTKTDTSLLSKSELKKISNCVNIPIVAIGGISAENILELKGCKVAGVAVVSGIFASKNIEQAAKKLLELTIKII